MPASPSRRSSAGWLDSVDRVAQVLSGVVDGVQPPSDGATEVVPQPPGPVAGVLAFDGHHIVAADVDPTWVHELLPNGDLSAPLHPRFLGALAERLGRPWDNLDAVFAGRGEEGDVVLPLEPSGSAADHPRVARSYEYRHDSAVYELPQQDGVLILGRGLSGRWEAAFEVAATARGRGLGRGLVRSALRLVPVGEPVFVQVAPGNVSSLRAVLAAGGYVPIGSEVLYPGPVSSGPRGARPLP